MVAGNVSRNLVSFVCREGAILYGTLFRQSVFVAENVLLHLLRQTSEERADWKLQTEMKVAGGWNYSQVLMNFLYQHNTIQHHQAGPLDNFTFKLNYSRTSFENMISKNRQH